MASPTLQRPYKGVFPVVPTVFDGDGRLDLDGQKRAVDFMIEAGSQGLCILANFSEQFVLTDAERETVLDAVLKHVAAGDFTPPLYPPFAFQDAAQALQDLADRKTWGKAVVTL